MKCISNVFLNVSTVIYLLCSSVEAMETPEGDREPAYIRMHPQSHPLLPDGSELASNGREIWVKTRGQAHYATSWRDYVQARRLNLTVIAVPKAETETLELRIIKGTVINLPDGAEAVVNPQNQVWVKTRGQSYYATSWRDYNTTLSTKIEAVVVERAPSPVELKLTRYSPLFKFSLPDGSEVHVNSANRVWIKTAEQAYPATRWEDYAYKNKLNFWPTVVPGASNSIELRIPRGGNPFIFPGGAEIAVDNVGAWVKEKNGPGYYATPFATFAQRIGLLATTSTLIAPPLGGLISPLPFTAPSECLDYGTSRANLTLLTTQRGYTTFQGTTIIPASFNIPELQRSTQKYNHATLLPPPRANNRRTIYRVTNQDSYIAAQELTARGLNPCVSNAAHATIPGGGFLSDAQAQEEEICRRSTLYGGLSPNLYPMSDEELIYTPGVTVFMEPRSYSFMDNPFKVSVVSQAFIALYERFLDLAAPETSAEYKRITKNKIRAQLRLAAVRGHNSFVATASGCGAFSRDRQGPVSEVVATLFREVITEEFQGVFTEVIFAILITNERNRIINEKFKEIIKPLNQ